MILYIFSALIVFASGTPHEFTMLNRTTPIPLEMCLGLKQQTIDTASQYPQAVTNVVRVECVPAGKSV